jgi:hypothetical protein
MDKKQIQSIFSDFRSKMEAVRGSKDPVTHIQNIVSELLNKLNIPNQNQ